MIHSLVFASALRRRLALALLALGATLLHCSPAAQQSGPASPSDSELGQIVPLHPKPVTAMDIEWQTSPVPISRQDPSIGSSAAPVTIVEFADLQCSYCARASKTLQAVREQYTGEQLRIVWKHFPLPFHDRAMATHRASAAVHSLGGNFWAFVDLAFAHPQQLTEENFLQWAIASGVPGSLFTTRQNDPEFAAMIAEDMQLGEQLGVSGTPQFYVNGLLLDGAVPAQQFTQAIDQQLQAARALAQSGVPEERLSFELTRDNFRPASAPETAELQEPADTQRWQIPVLEDDPVRGPSDALVTLVQWSDFECPFCARVQPVLEQLLQRYPEDLRVVWKDHPLPFHQRALPAALMARAVYQQRGNEAFWRVHDQLFSEDNSLQDDQLNRLAHSEKTSWRASDTATTQSRALAKLLASRELADDFSIRGTPHFFINGQRLVGAQPLEQFILVVEEQRKIAREQLAQGTPREGVYAQLMRTAQPAPLPEVRQLPAPDAAHPFRGAADAPIVIQQFSDFQCPYCARVNPTLEQLLKRFAGKIKIVWRHLPLPFHQYAQVSAEAAQEAFAQQGNTGFWAMHDLLFAHQDALTKVDLMRYAQQLHLDEVRFAQALDQHSHQMLVQSDIDLSQRAAISGTPAFVINGYFLAGAQPLHRFERLIERLLTQQELTQP